MKVHFQSGAEVVKRVRKTELRLTPENKAEEAALVDMLHTILLKDFMRPVGDGEQVAVVLDCYTDWSFGDDSQV